MEFKVEYWVDGTALSVRGIALSIRGLLLAVPAIQKDVELLDLALTEALNNIVFHSYHDYIGDIRVCIEYQEGVLKIEIVDNGKKIESGLIELSKKEASELLDKKAELLETSGRGLALIRSIMDEIFYERKQSENHLVLIKKYKN